MADYYPLLAKAVAGLDTNTVEARAAIYDRARSALLRQLAGIDPPVAQAIVDRELGALETVFVRIEHENSPADKPAEPSSGDTLLKQVLRDPPFTDPDARNPDARIRGEEALAAAAARPVAPANQRPQVRAVKASDASNRKPILAVALAVSVVAALSLATLAFLRRDDPPAVASQGAPPVQPPAPVNTPAPAKASDRVGSGVSGQDAAAPTASPSAPVAPASSNVLPAQPQASVQTAPPVQPAPQQPPAIAVANRAIFLLQGTEKDQPVIERLGSVVWRSEIVTNGGLPSDRMIRANIDVPDARLQVEVTIQRNRDTAFPASHTVQVRSLPAAGSEVGAIQGITTMEFRQAPEQTGYALAGQGIAVVDNLFLIALSLAEPSRSRNEEMMKSRPLIYFEFPTASGRRGAILIDKGISGQQAFDAAFASWQ